MLVPQVAEILDLEKRKTILCWPKSTTPNSQAFWPPLYTMSKGLMSNLHLFLSNLHLFFLDQKLSILHLFFQICSFFLFKVKRIFCCKICLYWVRLGLGSPQGLEKPPARARKAPCKGQDSNLSYFMVKKGADLTTFGWRKRCRFDQKKRCRFDKKGADLTTF